MAENISLLILLIPIAIIIFGAILLKIGLIANETFGFFLLPLFLAFGIYKLWAAIFNFESDYRIRKNSRRNSLILTLFGRTAARIADAVTGIVVIVLFAGGIFIYILHKRGFDFNNFIQTIR